MADTMPRNIDDFVAWRLLQYVAGYLAGIRRAAGYNTDPLFTLNFLEYRDSGAKYRLLLETVGHDTVEQTIGGSGGEVARFYQEVGFRIIATVSLIAGEIPRKQAMMLEQDVRTAINQAKANANSVMGRGFNFSFDACTHDAGSLTADEMAGFILEFSFTYPQGRIW